MWQYLSLLSLVVPHSSTIFPDYFFQPNWQYKSSRKCQHTKITPCIPKKFSALSWFSISPIHYSCQQFHRPTITFLIARIHFLVQRSNNLFRLDLSTLFDKVNLKSSLAIDRLFLPFDKSSKKVSAFVRIALACSWKDSWREFRWGHNESLEGLRFWKGCKEVLWFCYWYPERAQHIHWIELGDYAQQLHNSMELKYYL